MAQIIFRRTFWVRIIPVLFLTDLWFEPHNCTFTATASFPATVVIAAAATHKLFDHHHAFMVFVNFPKRTYIKILLLWGVSAVGSPVAVILWFTAFVGAAVGSPIADAGICYCGEPPLWEAADLGSSHSLADPATTGKSLLWGVIVLG